LLAHGRWLSLGTPASSSTGFHVIAEILLKVALNTINQIKSNHIPAMLFSDFVGFFPIGHLKGDL
jgi:hypothetical protein